ncbi:hypothetical protein T07_3170 [Trichinella nelsoni]|uniref:Uncharacterized protein n=1 Tax=Trichinella nelsoni TaxID=6336 RepID=A0A0V0RD56_9BILA|nr:hypothetical protein T07_3170 [Trichinella nelsoni]
MSFDGYQHRVPVFKRDFLSSLSREIGSKSIDTSVTVEVVYN